MTLFDDLQEHPIRAGMDLGKAQAQGLKGFAVTLRHLFRRPVTQTYPELQARRLPALPRPPPAAPAPERPREVHRLLALRRRLPGRLHPRRRGRERARRARLAGRALRAHLRDQHGALHLLRLLRGRVPVRRDHARQRLRALRALARRAHLHQGDAARAAAAAHAGAGSRPSSTAARRRSRAPTCSACTTSTRRTTTRCPAS